MDSSVINERRQRWERSNGLELLPVLDSLLPKPRPFVVDVGAYKGDFFSFILGMRPGAQVYAFEPNPRRGRKLCKHFADVPGVHVYPLALGDSNGLSALHITEANTLSSFLSPTQTGARIHGARIQECGMAQVELCRLHDFAKEREQSLLESVDLLKLDVQGYELQVLKGAGDLLHSTRIVVMEVGFEKIYKGQSLFSELDYYLSHNGFVLHGLYGTRVHTESGHPARRVSGDAVYLNTRAEGLEDFS